MTRHLRRDLFRALGVLAIIVGVLGSLTAWESGQIGLGQALVQVVIGVQVAYVAFAAALNTGRRGRGRKAVPHRAAVSPRAHAAGRAA